MSEFPPCAECGHPIDLRDVNGDCAARVMFRKGPDKYTIPCPCKRHSS